MTTVRGIWYNGSMNEYVVVQTTAPSEQLAMKISEHLVEQRLAACVQVAAGVRSIYRWQDQIERSDEWLCTAKTRRALLPAVEAAIAQLHSYDCPEIVALPIVDASDQYLAWLSDQLVAD